MSVLPESDRDERWWHRSTTWLAITAWVVIVVLAIDVPTRIGELTTTHGGLGGTSGVWAALADDVAHGVLYRPLLGPDGYGGTRYFPLAFVVHGTLIRAGLSALAAGHLVSLASIVLLLAGMVRVMRCHDVPLGVAVCVALCLLPAQSTLIAILTARGDALPAALNMWGLAFASERKPRVAFAGISFGLAFLGKVSTVFGVVAVVSAWLLERQHAQVKRLALGWAATGATGIVIGSAWSRGAWFESFRACASGRTSWTTLLATPANIFRSPDFDLVLILIGLACLFACTREMRRRIPALTFVVSAIVVATLFASPGVIHNHFLDVHAAALVFVGTQLRDQRALTLMLCGVTGMQLGVEWRKPHGRETDMQRVLSAIPRDGRPVLAENPWVPIMMGERPYVLDPFSMHVMESTHGEITRDLESKIQAKYFRAIVLQNDIREREDTTGRPLRYAARHFGGDFIRLVEANYPSVAHLGQSPSDQWVYTSVASAPSREPALTAIASDRSGVYTLRNQATARCIEVPYETQSNGPLWTFECNSGSAQQWLVRAARNDAYNITSASSGKCVDVLNQSSASGLTLQQYDCNGSEAQLWSIEPKSGGAHRIRSFVSGKCAAVSGGFAANGVALEQSDCTDAPSQRWILSGAQAAPR